MTATETPRVPEPILPEAIPQFPDAAAADEWLCEQRGWVRLGVACSPGCVYLEPGRPVAETTYSKQAVFCEYAMDDGSRWLGPQLDPTTLEHVHQVIATPKAEAMPLDGAVRHEIEKAIANHRHKDRRAAQAKAEAEASTELAVSKARALHYKARHRQ